MKILSLMLVYYLIFVCVQFYVFKQDRNRIIEFVPVLLLISLSLVLGTYRFRILGSISTMHVHSSILMLIMLVVYLLNKKMVLNKPINYFTGLLFLGVLIQVFIQKDILDWPNFTIVIGVYLLIFLMGLLSSTLQSINLNQVLYNFNYLAIFNGVLSVFQYLTGKALLIGSFSQSIVYTQGIVNTKRVVGLAGSNNAAGNLGVILFCICLYNLITQKNMLSLIALAITTIFSILTLTRIGYLSILIAFVIFFIGYENSSDKVHISKAKIIGWGTTSILIVAAIFHKPIIQKLFTDRGNTSGERFKQYMSAWKFGVQHHPFDGVGVGQWQSYSYYNFGKVDLPIHSLYYNVLIENGLIIFLAFIALNLYLIVRVIHDSKSRNLKIFYIALGIATFITVNFNPDQYYYVPNFIYYFVLLMGYRKNEILKVHLGTIQRRKQVEK